MKYILAFISILAMLSTVQGAAIVKSPIVSGLEYYIGNIFIYYTWNTSFVLCALWGALNIVFTADRGLAYSTCISNFQSVFVMNGGYINF
jgi:hypothetical protein